jgi:DNA-binding NtrC family response regulator
MPQHYSRLVLIVDDDPSDRKLFSRELEQQGLQVVATGSAEEAMAAIVGGKIGCLIADQVMAVRGQELAQIAAGVSRDLCVIVFSGAPHPREPIPPGALFVSKDDLPKLVQLVTQCMERWRTQN